MGQSSQVAYDHRVWASAKGRGWIAPIGVALLAFVLRVWNLGYPNKLLFDETYYAKDAWSLLKFGYVQDFVKQANKQIYAGDLDHLFTGMPSQIVHPDGGKWVIALGEWAFGLNAFGWRISAVIVGSLTVLVLARLVLRLTGSTLIASFAGLLLALDGVHFVLSRLALLDVFLTFWLVCAVSCLVADRDWIATRLERFHPLRPWQLAAGASFGMAAGTKWSAVYVIAIFGLAVVGWEVLARRKAWTEAAVEHRHSRPPNPITTAVIVGAPAFVSIVVVALGVYLATWTGWLIHHDVYEQRFGMGYGDTAPWGSYIKTDQSSFFAEAWQALRSLWHYHQMTYDFHTGDYLAGKSHPYQSNPAGWLVLDRPVGVDAQNDLSASLCGAPADSSCMRQVLILGNPVIWWSGALALLAGLGMWVRSRDWRWSVPLLGVAATWLPWFLYADRPIFLFYAVACLPFTIIALALVADRLRLRARAPRSRYVFAATLGLFTVAVVCCFWFFHPLYTDALIEYGDWRDRMWFARWI